MEKEDVFIKGENGTKISVDEWDNDAIWFYLTTRNCTVSCTIPKDQVKILISELQSVLDKETV